MKSSIVIIFNPAARKSSLKKIELAASLLKKRGFATEILISENRGDAEQLARVALGNAPRLIIAAGGDGTINEVVNGIVWSGVPLSIIPLGTTNVLAKELGVPEDLEGSVDRAVKGDAKTVSLGKIVLGPAADSREDHAPGPPRMTRYFCLMAGVGFDGKAVHDVNVKLKKISGGAAYILSGIRNFLSYLPDEIVFSLDGREYKGYEGIIGKAGKYGGDFSVTPDASLLAPSLYACIFQGGKRRDLLRYAFGVISGAHLKNRDIIYLESKNIEVLGAAHIQIDGDYMGVSPAKISVAKDALRLVW